MRRFPRLVMAVLGLGLVAGPSVAAAQGTAPDGPTLGIVHEVDATGEPVVLSVLTDTLDVAAGDVSIIENGTAITPSTVTPASDAERTGEVVFVIDTSERLASGGAFDVLKETLAEQILALPTGTRVAVVAAGDLALVRQAPTTDLRAAAESVGQLRMGTTAALWDAVERGASLFSGHPDRFRTLVAVSSSADGSRGATASSASADVLRAGAQAAAVRFRGGDPGLTTLTQRVGGAVYGVEGDAGLPDGIVDAVALGRDRLLVGYPSEVGMGRLAQVELSLGGVATSFSYTGGARFDRVTSLAPIPVDEPLTVPVLGTVFDGRTGLYLGLALAVVGVGLAVWALGSLVASSNENLDGRLSRYSVGQLDGDEAGGGLSQNALYRRAVAVTETIARDRGLLAKTERLLERANMPFRPAEALFFYAVVVVLSLVLGLALTRSLLATVVLTVLGVAGPYLFVALRVSRRERKFEAQLPDALQLLAGTLRAGYSLPQGMEAVSHEIEDPMGFELRRVMTEARLGRELEEALEAAAERLGSPDFAWAVMAISIQREVGGNLNELLMTVAETMVARERLRGEVKTLTAEGKMSAIILGGLPPALSVVMWVMNPGYINTLFSEGMGQVFIGLAVLSATVGLFWMKKVITIDV